METARLNVDRFVRPKKPPPFCLNISMWATSPESPSPLRRDTEAGPGAPQWSRSDSETYRHISPLARRVSPGILGSLYLPWCSGIGAARSVPVEREDYQLLRDSWWWISNGTDAPLNRRPTGITGVKMASLLHPGNPRSSLLLRLHPYCPKQDRDPPTKQGWNTFKSIVRRLLQ